MKVDVTPIYNLLPAIYRIRDAEQGEPLRAFLSVIAEQIAVLDESLAQSYDDLFIETCARMGRAVYRRSHRLSHDSRRSGEDQQPARAGRQYHCVPAAQRHCIDARTTCAGRNRLGRARCGIFPTPGDDAVYESSAAEKFICARSCVNGNRLNDSALLSRPPRIHSKCAAFASGRGKYNIPNIGIFLWRLRAYSLSDSPAAKLDDGRYFFSPLGNNTPLFNSPETEEEITHLATPQNVPMPISRRVLDAYLDTYYGRETGKSIFIRVNGSGIDSSEIVVCNLSDVAGNQWAHTPPKGKIAVDPVLGRIAFRDPQNGPPLVTFHYGFSADMSGGEYDRAATLDALLAPVEKVPAPHATIQDGLDAVTVGGVVEISDSGRYSETPSINVNASQRIELRAADGHRPTVIATNPIDITGGADAEVTLNGLLIAGGPIRVLSVLNNGFRKLRLVHCTLVPGLALGIDGAPGSPGVPSLLIEQTERPMEVEIDHCIIGAVRAPPNATVLIRASIVDANSDSAVAYSDLDDIGAGGTMSVVNSTIIGTVHTLELNLASNSIFISDVRSEKKQSGCVRFCYLPLTSIVPRRYRCQPEEESDALRLRPQFTSMRYGDPGYGQLALRTAAQIRSGADDEAEMGAFNELMQPQRENDLRVRLDEYLRFGLEAGIFYAT